MSAIIKGVRNFQSSVYPSLQDRFEGLAGGQSPMALMITCSDSRVDPNLFTGTKPGELFVIRNAGNIVPDASEYQEGVLATIEYAVAVLNVPEIIVCGHSQCGAMGGLLAPDSVKPLPLVSHWLKQSQPALEGLPESDDPAESLWNVTLANVQLQLDRLMAVPQVAERVKSNDLALNGWCYQFESGEVFVMDSETRAFSPLRS